MELRHIIEEGYRKTLPADQTICRENDPGDSFYIILSGTVEVFVESIGKRVATRKSGEFIGEMSLLMGTPRTATLRTLEETMLFVVDRDNLQSLLAKHEALADRISEELSKRQETLERLGITVSSTEQDETPFAAVRKRIKSIFGI
ncbi:cyclic nucleotide-binding domain-containing protein [Moorena sp. SIO2C4]|nr:cyclic nucleotide-binding domain-containing protein [Moorena sp. SIO2C4]